MSYYHEGTDAKWRGESIFKCPYKLGTAGYSYWCRGWIDALSNVVGNDYGW